MYASPGIFISSVSLNQLARKAMWPVLASLNLLSGLMAFSLAFFFLEQLAKMCLFYWSFQRLLNYWSPLLSPCSVSLLCLLTLVHCYSNPYILLCQFLTHVIVKISYIIVNLSISSISCIFCFFQYFLRCFKVKGCFMFL